MNVYSSYRRGKVTLSGDPAADLWIVPGAGSRAAHFQSFVECTSVRAAALDLPGHGDNSESLCTSISAMAEALEEALQTLDHPVVLLGHSMGGAVAIETALRGKVNLKALILYSTGARLKVSPVIFEVLQAQEARVRTREQVRPFFSPMTPDSVVDVYLSLPDHSTNRQALTDFHAVNLFDRMADLGNIRLPTLVVGGDLDFMTPAKYQEHLAATIPGAVRVVVEGAGHLAHLEKPAAFQQAVESFIKGRVGATD
ncbi:MAG: alpha/beta hydrolase [Polyangiaceae bacterium]|nr:alpha/beta hydrolase [Polyangiaceae bacterium]